MAIGQQTIVDAVVPDGDDGIVGRPPHFSTVEQLKEVGVDDLPVLGEVDGEIILAVVLFQQGHELPIAVECTALTAAELRALYVEHSLIVQIEDRHLIHELRKNQQLH